MNNRPPKNQQQQITTPTITTTTTVIRSTNNRTTITNNNRTTTMSTTIQSTTNCESTTTTSTMYHQQQQQMNKQMNNTTTINNNNNNKQQHQQDNNNNNNNQSQQWGHNIQQTTTTTTITNNNTKSTTTITGPNKNRHQWVLQGANNRSTTATVSMVVRIQWGQHVSHNMVTITNKRGSTTLPENPTNNKSTQHPMGKVMYQQITTRVPRTGKKSGAGPHSWLAAAGWHLSTSKPNNRPSHYRGQSNRQVTRSTIRPAAGKNAWGRTSESTNNCRSTGISSRHESWSCAPWV